MKRPAASVPTPRICSQRKPAPSALTGSAGVLTGPGLDGVVAGDPTCGRGDSEPAAGEAPDGDVAPGASDGVPEASEDVPEASE